MSSAARDESVDLVIAGGGIAGLWLLRAALERGYSALLIEGNSLGAGQTIASQGILHGGLKYTLDGLFSPSADAIRDMPARWMASIRGERAPDLTSAKLRAAHCHLWRTSGLSSVAGMVGAKLGLRVKPKKLERADWPVGLAGCPGEVFQLDEPVLDVASVLRALATPVAGRIVLGRIDELRQDERGVMFRVSPSDLIIRAETAVLTAGRGNAELRRMAGLDAAAQQLRPLHMVMARGTLPALNGHCVDGATTRVTITSAVDSRGRAVWQIGGRVSEAGVAMSQSELISHARDEIAAVLPSVKLADVEWATYRVDRAEPATPGGRRPEGAHAVRENRIISAWPTKLVLAPKLADDVLALCDPPGEPRSRSEQNGRETGANVAPEPWEEDVKWSLAR